MRRLVITAVVALATAVFAGPALAVPTATPFGGATVEDGILRLVSNTGDASATNDSSGATFTDVGVTTFASLTALSTEFNVTDDDCGGGSPRFQIGVQTPSGTKNIHVYLGPTPSFTGCTANAWLASGNLIGAADLRFDTTQLPGGTFYDSYAHALTLAGSFAVTSLRIVVDSGWFFPDKEQTVLIRNLRVNAALFFQPQAVPPGQSLSPAKACAKLRTMIGDSAFKLMWGTNANRSNAFGKCVSHMAQLKNDAARTADVQALAVAARQCVAMHGKPAKAKGKAKGKLTACLRQAR